MEYSEFQKRLNNKIFNENLNYELLITILQNPKRYIGLFRITNAKTKLIQNLTQSCEIKFGDFIEEILSQYITEMKYESLDKYVGFDEDGNKLRADQVFKDKQYIYIVEQKIRDDHDSTKKRGQYANLIKKIKALKLKYPHKKIQACMWFSDDGLSKNKKFYKEQIANNTDSQVKISIFYGKEIFKNLFHRLDIWDELISHLRKNKEERSKEILNIPDFDTSNKIRRALLKIKENNPKLIINLLSDKPDFLELRKELFPCGKNLKDL